MCIKKRGGVKVFFNTFVVHILCLLASVCVLVSCAGGASGGSMESGASSLCVHMPATRATYAVSDAELFTVAIDSSAYSSSKSCGQGKSLTFSNIQICHFVMVSPLGRLTRKAFYLKKKIGYEVVI